MDTRPSITKSRRISSWVVPIYEEQYFDVPTIPVDTALYNGAVESEYCQQNLTFLENQVDDETIRELGQLISSIPDAKGLNNVSRRTRDKNTYKKPPIVVQQLQSQFPKLFDTVYAAQDYSSSMVQSTRPAEAPTTLREDGKRAKSKYTIVIKTHAEQEDNHQYDVPRTVEQSLFSDSAATEHLLQTGTSQELVNSIQREIKQKTLHNMGDESVSRLIHDLNRRIQENNNALLGLQQDLDDDASQSCIECTTACCGYLQLIQSQQITRSLIYSDHLDLVIKTINQQLQLNVLPFWDMRLRQIHRKDLKSGVDSQQAKRKRGSKSKQGDWSPQSIHEDVVGRLEQCIELIGQASSTVKYEIAVLLPLIRSLMQSLTVCALPGLNSKCLGALVQLFRAYSEQRGDILRQFFAETLPYLPFKDVDKSIYMQFENNTTKQVYIASAFFVQIIEASSSLPSLNSPADLLKVPILPHHTARVICQELINQLLKQAKQKRNDQSHDVKHIMTCLNDDLLQIVLTPTHPGGQVLLEELLQVVIRQGLGSQDSGVKQHCLSLLGAAVRCVFENEVRYGHTNAELCGVIRECHAKILEDEDWQALGEGEHGGDSFREQQQLFRDELEANKEEVCREYSGWLSDIGLVKHYATCSTYAPATRVHVIECFANIVLQRSKLKAQLYAQQASTNAHATDQNKRMLRELSLFLQFCRSMVAGVKSGLVDTASNTRHTTGNIPLLSKLPTGFALYKHSRLFSSIITQRRACINKLASFTRVGGAGDQALVRSRAVRLLGKVIEVAPFVLQVEQVRQGISAAMKDSFASVQEAALDILDSDLNRGDSGSHTETSTNNKTSAANASVYYDLLASCIRNKSLKVKKRAMTIVYDKCIQTPGFRRINEALSLIASHINDDNVSMQQLVITIFSHVWSQRSSPIVQSAQHGSDAGSGQHSAGSKLTPASGTFRDTEAQSIAISISQVVQQIYFDPYHKRRMPLKPNFAVVKILACVFQGLVGGKPGAAGGKDARSRSNTMGIKTLQSILKEYLNAFHELILSRLTTQANPYDTTLLTYLLGLHTLCSAVDLFSKSHTQAQLTNKECANILIALEPFLVSYQVPGEGEGERKQQADTETTPGNDGGSMQTPTKETNIVCGNPQHAECVLLMLVCMKQLLTAHGSMSEHYVSAFYTTLTLLTQKHPYKSVANYACTCLAECGKYWPNQVPLRNIVREQLRNISLAYVRYRDISGVTSENSGEGGEGPATPELSAAAQKERQMLQQYISRLLAMVSLLCQHASGLLSGYTDNPNDSSVPVIDMSLLVIGDSSENVVDGGEEDLCAAVVVQLYHAFNVQKQIVLDQGGDVVQQDVVFLVNCLQSLGSFFQGSPRYLLVPEISSLLSWCLSKSAPYQINKQLLQTLTELLETESMLTTTLMNPSLSVNGPGADAADPPQDVLDENETLNVVNGCGDYQSTASGLVQHLWPAIVAFTRGDTTHQASGSKTAVVRQPPPAGFWPEARRAVMQIVEQCVRRGKIAPWEAIQVLMSLSVDVQDDVSMWAVGTLEWLGNKYSEYVPGKLMSGLQEVHRVVAARGGAMLENMEQVSRRLSYLYTTAIQPHPAIQKAFTANLIRTFDNVCKAHSMLLASALGGGTKDGGSGDQAPPPPALHTGLAGRGRGDRLSPARVVSVCKELLLWTYVVCGLQYKRQEEVLTVLLGINKVINEHGQYMRMRMKKLLQLDAEEPTQPTTNDQHDAPLPQQSSAQWGYEIMSLVASTLAISLLLSAKVHISQLYGLQPAVIAMFDPNDPAQKKEHVKSVEALESAKQHYEPPRLNFSALDSVEQTVKHFKTYTKLLKEDPLDYGVSVAISSNKKGKKLQASKERLNNMAQQKKLDWVEDDEEGEEEWHSDESEGKTGAGGMVKRKKMKL